MEAETDRATQLWLCVVNHNEAPQNRADAEQQLIQLMKQMQSLERNEEDRREFYKKILPMVLDQTAKGMPGGGIYNSHGSGEYEFKAPPRWQIYYSVSKISGFLLLGHTGKDYVPPDDPRRRLLGQVTLDLLKGYISNGYPDPPWQFPKDRYHGFIQSKSLAVYSEYHNILRNCWVDEAAESVQLVSQSHPNPTARAMASLLLCDHGLVTFESLKMLVQGILDTYEFGTIVTNPDADENLQFCTFLWSELFSQEKRRVFENNKFDSDLDIQNEFVRFGFLLMRLWSGGMYQADTIRTTLGCNLLRKHSDLREQNSVDDYWNWWLKTCGDSSQQ